MNTIKRLSSRQATIYFPDFVIRIFVKYSGAGAYCSAIRIYKLPPRSSVLSMFKRKNLFWAFYGDEAARLHGWFSTEGNLLKALAERIVQCKDSEELKELLIDCERIMRGGYPSGKLLDMDIEEKLGTATYLR